MEELCKIAVGDSKDRHLFRSVLGEKFLEQATTNILAHLIEIKQEGQKLIKNPIENRLLHHYVGLKELLTQREYAHTKKLHFNSKVNRLYMEGDASGAISIKKRGCRQCRRLDLYHQKNIRKS